MSDNSSMIWEKYGFKFWVGFFLLALVMVIMGVFSIFSAGNSYIQNGLGVSVLVSLIIGLTSFIGGICCFCLFPRWAEMVREARMGNERLKGVVGSVSVSQYIQADENRNRILMESIERKQNDVGGTLARKIENSDTRTSALLTQLQSSLAAINAKLSSMSDPAEIDHYKNMADKLKNENKWLRNEINNSLKNTVKNSDEEEVSDFHGSEDLKDTYENSEDKAEDEEPLGYLSNKDKAEDGFTFEPGSEDEEESIESDIESDEESGDDEEDYDEDDDSSEDDEEADDNEEDSDSEEDDNDNKSSSVGDYW